MTTPSLAERWPARCGGRGATLPPLAWLALQAAALWPHWRWAIARMRDGSDDPLGAAALLVLGLLLLRLAPRLRATPAPAWLAMAVAATLAATAAGAAAPPLLGALFAVLALAAGLRAFMPVGEPTLPMAGLAVLSLPLLSSLQFYASFPLRVLTAQLSTWLLQLCGLAAERMGTAMQVQGRLIIVDAPCSGVQMVWMAYFCACSVAAFSRLSQRQCLARLPAVGALVLLGNVLRNSVLVALDAQPAPVSETTHQAVGLLVLAGVCLGVVAVFRWGRAAAFSARAQAESNPAPTARGAPAAAPKPGLQRLLLAALVLVGLAPLAFRSSSAEAASGPSPEWPREWQGRPLRPLALSAVEARFAARLPGHIARLTDGEQVLVLRELRQPTRRLHPAADCYRGLGYRIVHERLESDAQQQLWRCFVAERDGRRTRVCERIVDAAGQAYTDASSWYWAAQLGRSLGPWQAITTARPL